MTITESQQDTIRKDKGAAPSQPSKWILWLVGLIAILGIGFTLWMFWSNVYAYEGHIRDGFSKKSIDWGTFGGYVGGVLSPFFSLLAFVALLWTINIQMRALNISSEALTVSRDELKLTREELTKTADAAQQQVQHFQDESKRTDLYRIIEKLVARIDYNYQKVPVRDSFTFIDFVRKNSNISPGNLPALLSLSKNETTLAFLTTRLIESDLTNLLCYFKEYEKSSDVLRDFYRDEYKNLVNFLSDNDMLLDKGFAKTFINP
ncbi:MAG: hypothetical protein Q8L15_11605 [Methylobacter sp.]|nr:hypothetical protein [Methylobacter sp.]